MELDLILLVNMVWSFETWFILGKPFEANIGDGKLLKGLDQGIPNLSLGEKGTLIITP